MLDIDGVAGIEKEILSSAVNKGCRAYKPTLSCWRWAEAVGHISALMPRGFRF
jgi:hypothetical protein